MAKGNGGRKNVGTTDQTLPKSRSKQISHSDVGGSTTNDYFVWDTSILDHEVSGDGSCDWTWDISAKDLKGFLTFMAECSKRTWGEIESDTTGGKNRHKKHHFHEVDRLPKCAQDRLLHHLDESYTNLFRLRYGGTQRVWGVRERAAFRLLWLDLDHKVYPTEKD